MAKSFDQVDLIGKFFLALKMLSQSFRDNHSIHPFHLEKAANKSLYFLGPGPKLWMGGGQES